MNRNTDYMPRDSYFPNEKPPDELTKDFISDEDIEDLTPEDKHILLWITALATAFEKEKVWKKIPGFKFVTYGMGNLEFEKEALGIIVNAAFMPERETEGLEIEISTHKFPIFIRQSVELFDSPLGTNPANGTACFWAKSKRINDNGFLTAKHILPKGVFVGKYGSYIALDKGKTLGKVVDLASDGIDAALIKPDNMNHNFQNSVDIIKYITPFTKASFHGASSGKKIDTRITSVSDPRGMFKSSYFPIRILLSDYGIMGDSGAAVIDNNGKGLGIYTGRLKDVRGLVEGMAQHLAQAVHNMDLVLFD